MSADLSNVNTPRSLEAIAAMLKREQGITVEVGGSSAYCDIAERRIVVPAMGDEISDEALTLVRRFIDHETGHLVGNTTYDGKVVVNERTGNPKAGDVLNALEDIRCDDIVRKMYAGCEINYTEGTEITLRKIKESGNLHKLPPLMQASYAVFGFYDKESVLSEVSPEIREAMEQFRSEIERVPEATCTEDLYDLTERIVEAIAGEGEGQGEGKSEESDDAEGDNGSEADGEADGDDDGEADGDDTQPGQPGDGDESGEADGDAEGDDDGEADGDVDAAGDGGEPDEGDESGDQTQGKGSGGSGTDEPEGDGIEGKPAQDAHRGGYAGHTTGDRSPLNKAVEDAALESRKTGEHKPSLVPLSELAIESEDVRKINLEAGKRMTGSERTSEDPRQTRRNDVRSAGAAARKLGMLFDTDVSTRWSGNRTRGMVDPAAIAGLATGTNARPMRTRKIERGSDTVVDIQIDMSGSMDGYKALSAAQSAAVMAESIESARHSYRVAAWSARSFLNPSTPIIRQAAFCGWHHCRMRNDRDYEGTLDEVLRRVVGYAEHLPKHGRPIIRLAMEYVAKGIESYYVGSGQMDTESTSMSFVQSVLYDILAADAPHIEEIVRDKIVKNEGDDSLLLKNNRDLVGDTVPFDRLTLIDWNQSCRSYDAAEWMQAFPGMADGGTPMDSAVLSSAFDLSRRSENRKVMIVIADGCPNSPGATREAVERAEATGVECIGIGIGGADMSPFFANAVKVNDLTDLSTTVLTELRKVLA